MATKGKPPGSKAQALRAGGVLRAQTLSPALSAAIDGLDAREVKALIEIHGKISRGVKGGAAGDPVLGDGNFFW